MVVRLLNENDGSAGIGLIGDGSPCGRGAMGSSPAAGLTVVVVAASAASGAVESRMPSGFNTESALFEPVVVVTRVGNIS